MVTTEETATILVRFLHITSGVLWIGLLYYFNVVQVPVFKRFDAATRSQAIQKLSPPALAWFRYGALATIVFGFLLLWLQNKGYAGGFNAYFQTGAGWSIAVGMTLGVIMFLNVWLVIWPNQAKIIHAHQTNAAQGTPVPSEAAQWAKQALFASRTNFVLSFPMLFFMAATGHIADAAGRDVTLLMGAAILVAAIVVLWIVTNYKGATAQTPTAPASPKT